jgi:hypothetical protein
VDADLIELKRRRREARRAKRAARAAVISVEPTPGDVVRPQDNAPRPAEFDADSSETWSNPQGSWREEAGWGTDVDQAFVDAEDDGWGWRETSPQQAAPADSLGGEGDREKAYGGTWGGDAPAQTRRRRRRPSSESQSSEDWDDGVGIGRRGARDADVEDEASEELPGGPPPDYEPDIVLLSPQELDRVLPVVPFWTQASFFNGGAAQAVQRWGASLALTVLLSKAALLAATSLTWPLWWPWAQAAVKNYGLRKQAGYAGLWRTEVLEVESRGRPRVQYGGAFDAAASRRTAGDQERSENRGSSSSSSSSSSFGPSRFSTMRTTRFVLGDPEGGATTEVVLPHDARYDLVRPGQPAELIVLSFTPTFESFKAVKDVYLPDCGLWLSEYPFLDRTEFLELSLDIEREAAAMASANDGKDAFQEAPFDSDGYRDTQDGYGNEGYYYNNSYGREDDDAYNGAGPYPPQY